jgi:hypothetical protein
MPGLLAGVATGRGGKMMQRHHALHAAWSSRLETTDLAPHD